MNRRPASLEGPGWREKHAIIQASEEAWTLLSQTFPPASTEALLDDFSCNLVNWLDAIFEICSNAGGKSRDQAGETIQGTYEGLLGHKYGRMESMISNTLPLFHDLTDPAAPLSAGQFRVYWGGGGGLAQSQQ